MMNGLEKTYYPSKSVSPTSGHTPVKACQIVKNT